MNEQSNAALNADPRTRAVQRRVVISLSLAQLFSGLGHGAGLAIGSLLAVELSGSEALAGTSTMAISLAAALAALPLAGAAARSGRRRALVTGLLLALLGSALMALAPVTGSFAVLLAGSALLGVGNAANLQARFAAVDLAVPQHRGRDLAFVVWSITVGAVAGPNLIRPGAELGAALGLPESIRPLPVFDGRHGHRRHPAAAWGCGPTRCVTHAHAAPGPASAPDPGETLPVRRRGTLRTGYGRGAPASDGHARAGRGGGRAPGDGGGHVHDAGSPASAGPCGRTPAQPDRHVRDHRVHHFTAYGRNVCALAADGLG